MRQRVHDHHICNTMDELKSDSICLFNDLLWQIRNTTEKSRFDVLVMLSHEMTIHFISLVNPFRSLLLHLSKMNSHILKLRTRLMLIDIKPNKQTHRTMHPNDQTEKNIGCKVLKSINFYGLQSHVASCPAPGAGTSTDRQKKNLTSQRTRCERIDQMRSRCPTD